MKKLVLIIAILFTGTVLFAQETEKKSKKELKAEKQAQQIAVVKALVESKTFVFKARTANPMKGRSVNLTSDYDMTIKGDSIYSYMPYFGQAYSAPYGSNESPMTFDKPIEKYTSEPAKQGYMVKVRVKNNNDLIDCTYHISETGSTTLSVSSTNRSAITYFGDIEKIEEKKK